MLNTKQPFLTLRDTHTKLCHFNNGACCGYDSKTKSRPASITFSFKLFPHKKQHTSYNARDSDVKWEKMAIIHVPL